MGKIIAIAISEKRGTKKQCIDTAMLIKGFGVENDAHGGDWHRQVSLLPKEKIDEFKSRGANVSFGDFGENIVTQGIDYSALQPGAVLVCGEVILQLTQKGKECHAHCEIYKQVGDCIMPREGVFARVLKGGQVTAGDEIEVQKIKAAVLTVSDKGFSGQRADESGQVLAQCLKAEGYEVAEKEIVPDEQPLIEQALRRLCKKAQLVLTTGGTGFAKRDVTPEATLAVADKNARGIAEAVRAYSMTITPRAMLSRGESVICGESLIINLPGSPKACRECAEYILPNLPHGLAALRGEVQDCAQ